MFPISRKQCVKIILILTFVELIIILQGEIKLHLPSFFFGSWLENNDHVYRDDEPAESFLQLHREYCQQNLFPNPLNVASSFTQNYNSSLCDCVPAGLLGRITSNANIDSLSAPSSKEGLISSEPASGGTWSPRDCVARQRVAVIIPYRDRSVHLNILLNVLHPMLQRQLLHYTIYVVEQAEPEVFNKASLMNAGFREASSQANYDCYIFHDVDMIPEDDRNFYVCSQAPRHVGAHLSQWEYRLPYDQIFGGVTAFTKQQFEKINGFSNQYYGWGGEDDDMYTRVRAHGFSVVRFPREISRYNMIQHAADPRNPYNVRSTLGFRVRLDHYAKDGVNSVRYRKVATELRPSYVWISVALPQPPPNFRSYSRHSLSSVNVASWRCILLLLLARCLAVALLA